MSDDRDAMLPALRALGDSLGAAARREIEPVAAEGRGEAGGPRTRQRRLSRHGRLAGVAAGVTLVAAGAATAGDLISTGEPARAPDALPADVRPAPGDRSPIVLRAPDGEAGGAWGIRTYTATGGLRCAVGGWVRGASVGRVEGGTFRAYPADQTGTTGTCDEDLGIGANMTIATVAEPAPRTLVYGFARPGIRTVTISDGEDRHVARVSQGVYLLVLEGRESAGRVRLADAR